jgi:hypothetical protein
VSGVIRQHGIGKMKREGTMRGSPEKKAGTDK